MIACQIDGKYWLSSPFSAVTGSLVGKLELTLKGKFPLSRYFNVYKGGRASPRFLYVISPPAAFPPEDFHFLVSPTTTLQKRPTDN